MEERPRLWINSLTNRLVQRMSHRTRTATSHNQPDLFGGATGLVVAMPEEPPTPSPRIVEPIARQVALATREAVRIETVERASAASPPSRVREAEKRAVHLLDVRGAAAWLGLSKSTLDKMRCYGAGPRFIRATGRAVRYDPADLAAFAEERRQFRTDDPAP